MTGWISLRAIGEIIVVGLLAGAGLPALFALGLRALGTPGKGHVKVSDEELVGGNPAGNAIAAVCFAVVLAAVGYGIYIIVISGHGAK
ncbi:MAG TPA: hypothetical protein VMA73_03935 [Streptosporangiaceae bacterium]|nr:hypothetical protein [Streptosporangiaceae bacterium]